MISESQSQSDVVDDSGIKRKRFSLFQREPNNEVYREYNYHDNHEGYIDEETIKVEMGRSVENKPGEVKSEMKTGRGRPKKQIESHEWSDEATEALIYFWNQKEELYQKQHPYFYIREHKEKAVESIRISLEEQGHIVTANQILSKFQSLRTYFCSQRNKMIASRNSGAKSEEEIESKWRFYKNLMFLDENMKPRDTQSNKKYNVIRNNSIQESNFPPINSIPRVNATLDDTIHFQPELNQMQGDYSQNSMVTVGITHLPRETYENTPEYRKSPELNSEIAANDVHNGSTKNEDLLFGELVGNMLQQLPPGQRKDFLKLEIQQLIIKVKYTTPPEFHNDTQT